MLAPFPSVSQSKVIRTCLSPPRLRRSVQALFYSQARCVAITHSVELTIQSQCNPRKTTHILVVILITLDGAIWFLCFRQATNGEIYGKKKIAEAKETNASSHGTRQYEWLNAPSVHVTRDCKAAFMMLMGKCKTTWNRPSVTMLLIGIGFVSFRQSTVLSNMVDR